MNPWDSYKVRNTLHGTNGRDRAKYNLMNRLSNQIPSILSYHNVDIDGEERNIVVINSDNLDTKTLCSLPGEDIRHGALVEWMNNRWLVIERDANTEIYTKCIMRQCNYLLRWINQDGKIVERWCIVVDGTKYLTGEYSDSFIITTKGDSRISIIMQKDTESLALGRESRFIVDDYGVPNPLAYRLTKPYKLGGSFDNNGIVTFVLTECNTEVDDNLELHIADYYKFFPRDNDPEQDSNSSNTDNTDTERQVWI